jgi:hypothetical protein
MKKILAILVMLAALLASCDSSGIKTKPTESSYVSYNIFVDTIRGHEYIILDGFHLGNIIHSASCPCKKGGDK